MKFQFCQFSGMHCAFGLFASIIAPFGGFFASGFKRAFKVEVYLDTVLIS